MKVFSLLFGLFLVMLSAAQVPYHDHVVVVVMENKTYSEILNAPTAFYINQLAHDSETALFTDSYALTYPSQPNYLMLFSGSDQNQTTNATPSAAMLPFSSANLGASLLAKGRTFKGYSEGLPSEGYSGDSLLSWVRRHCPWINWQGAAGANAIPPYDNVPFSEFPADFDSLPTVSFVVPDLNHDMHNGTIQDGDTWLMKNLGSYVQWAKTHNSLFILTFDEDGHAGSNHILTLFAGQNVIPGTYPAYINHYSILRTLEEMYGLSYAGNTASSNAIVSCWKAAGINDPSVEQPIIVFPNPAADELMFANLKAGAYDLCLFDAYGREIFNDRTDRAFCILPAGLPNGMYFLRLAIGLTIRSGKIIVQR